MLSKSASTASKGAQVASNLGKAAASGATKMPTMGGMAANQGNQTAKAGGG